MLNSTTPPLEQQQQLLTLTQFAMKTFPLLTFTAVIGCFPLFRALAEADTAFRSVTAVHIRSGPVIDGILTDTVWTLAQPAVDFTQRDPWEGQPASERTEIRVLYDQEALYFGCMYFDSRPSAIVARLMRRDDEGESDWGSIRIDTFHDHQNAYEFSFNPAGVKVDILQFDDGEREDESWDAVWDLETRITDQGWSAEIKIPFSMLRYPSASDSSSGATWGINFIRKISRNYEQSRWAFTPKRESGFISRFGHLEGLNEIPSPRRLELLPFVVSRQQWDAGTELRPPTASYSPQAGVDLKAGIGNNLTLDATVNPDFGQVEADPAVLNLSTFETFYPEKRPFFIEGTQIFRFATFGDGAGPGMFCSRRIGRAISQDELSVPEGGHIIDAPSSATILAAAKLSGKFDNGTSMGVLQAFTRKETGIIEDSLGQRFEQILEPLSSYSMVRVKHDVFGDSYIGGILTSTAKTSRLPAITGGADWNIRLDNTTYQLNGFVAASHVSSEDGERITGSAGRLQFGRIAAVHWLWSLSGDYTTPHYDINDIGYFRRPNDFGRSAR